MSGTARSIAVGEGEVTLESATAEVTTRACPNGPVLVRGGRLFPHAA